MLSYNGHPSDGGFVQPPHCARSNLFTFLKTTTYPSSDALSSTYNKSYHTVSCLGVSPTASLSSTYNKSYHTAGMTNRPCQAPTIRGTIQFPREPHVPALLRTPDTSELSSTYNERYITVSTGDYALQIELSSTYNERYITVPVASAQWTALSSTYNERYITVDTLSTTSYRYISGTYVNYKFKNEFVINYCPVRASLKTAPYL